MGDSTKTWARIGMISAVAGVAGSAFTAIGSAVGPGSFGSTLSDIGKIANQIGQTGIQLAVTGASASASTKAQAQALVNAAPIVTALTSGFGVALSPQEKALQLQREQLELQKKEAARGGAGKGIVDMLVELLLLPFKLLEGLLAPRAG